MALLTTLLRVYKATSVLSYLKSEWHTGGFSFTQSFLQRPLAALPASSLSFLHAFLACGLRCPLPGVAGGLPGGCQGTGKGLAGGWGERRPSLLAWCTRRFAPSASYLPCLACPTCHLPAVYNPR